MLHANDLGSLVGASVIDRDGDRIGTVAQLLVEGDVDEPTWASVRTGRFGTAESLVPLHDASFVDGELRVGVTSSHIEDAPRTDADGVLDKRDEDRLHAHYGLTDAAADDADAVDHGATGTLGHSADASSPLGRESEGVSVDGSFTPTEAQPHLGEGPTGAGRARLRQWVAPR